MEALLDSVTDAFAGDKRDIWENYVNTAEDDAEDREFSESEVRRWIDKERHEHAEQNERVIARHLGELPADLRAWAEATHAELYRWLHESYTAGADDYYGAADAAVAAAAEHAAGDTSALDRFAARVATYAEADAPEDRPRLPSLSDTIAAVPASSRRLAFCGSSLSPKAKAGAEFCSCRSCGSERKRRQRAKRSGR